MKILFILLLLPIPVSAQALLEPTRVSITASKSQECSEWLADALRDELRQSGKVALRTKGADWAVFLDVAPHEELGCGGYSVAMLVVDRRQKDSQILRVYAGASINA